MQLTAGMLSNKIQSQNLLGILFSLGWNQSPEADDVLTRKFASDAELQSVAWSALNGLITSGALVRDSWFTFGLETLVMKTAWRHAFNIHPSVKGLFMVPGVIPEDLRQAEL